MLRAYAAERFKGRIKSSSMCMFFSAFLFIRVLVKRCLESFFQLKWPLTPLQQVLDEFLECISALPVQPTETEAHDARLLWDSTCEQLPHFQKKMSVLHTATYGLTSFRRPVSLEDI